MSLLFVLIRNVSMFRLRIKTFKKHQVTGGLRDPLKSQRHVLWFKFTLGTTGIFLFFGVWTGIMLQRI